MPGEDYKPDGWETLVPERETRFDPKKRRNFSVNRDGSIAWHELPEGFRFNKDGELQPVEPKEETAPAAAPEG